MNPPVMSYEWHPHLSPGRIRAVATYWLVCGALAMLEVGLRWLHAGERGQR